MKSYQVRFRSEFYADLIDSYDWGVEYWGEQAAISWSEQIESKILEILSRSPMGCSKAPESDLVSGEEIRQLIIGRYRVLFAIHGAEVLVLSLRGPFNSSRA